MFTIGTAGHIDHGKSSLVEMLTGSHPDRLPEEKRRGMTIDLGFASLVLPSGNLMGIVDVPGHERFIRNMVAGVGGIDAVLFAIAADEGVMPQTREHLDIINLLGIERGVIALTKTDLINDHDWIELVTTEILELLEATRLRGSAIVPVSAAHTKGIPELLGALDAVLTGVQRPKPSGDARLPVDRTFSVAGFGTVVTGTLQDGALELDTKLDILPGSGQTRVRGIQIHGQDVAHAMPGARVAVNLTGLAASDIPKGAVLVPHKSISPTRLLDAQLQILPHAQFPLRNGREIYFYTGTSGVRTTVRLLDTDTLYAGQTGWAQMRTTNPVTVRPGDRFILRQLSPVATLGGGVVVRARAARIRRHDKKAIQNLEQVFSGSRIDFLTATIELYGKLVEEEFAKRVGFQEIEFRSALDAAVSQGRIAAIDSTYYSANEIDRLWAKLMHALEAFHTAHPLRSGIPKEELRNQLSLSPTNFAGLIGHFAATGDIHMGDIFVALPKHNPSLNKASEAAAQSLLDLLSNAGIEVPALQETAVRQGVHASVLDALVDSGRLVRIAHNIGYDRRTFDLLVDEIRNLIRERGRIDVSGLRDHFASSRKYCVALLEYLDSTAITRRVGNYRVLRGHRKD